MEDRERQLLQQQQRLLQQQANASRMWVVVLGGLACFFLAWALIFTGLYYEKPADDHPVTAQACSLECICSVDKYIGVFNKSSLPPNSEDALSGPACVSSDIVGMVASIDQGNIFDTTYLKWPGMGRRIAFVGGPRLLEKYLVFGKFDARSILINIGFGNDPVMTGKDYYLIVFDKPETIFKAHWENLEPVLNTIYGSRSPDISGVIQELADNTFEAATGCPPPNGDRLNTSLCDACFREAAALFRPSMCAEPFSPTFSEESDCAAEDTFLELGSSMTACQLRAYLYATQGFAPEYTGYGVSCHQPRFQKCFD